MTKERGPMKPKQNEKKKIKEHHLRIYRLNSRNKKKKSQNKKKEKIGYDI